MELDHYQRLIGKIIDCIKPGNKDSKEMDGLVNALKSVTEDNLTWPMVFLSSKVDIVGFGLDFAETDFWWLLTLRASLLGQYGQTVFNPIRYFYIYGCESDDNRQSAVISALEMLSVECIGVRAGACEESCEERYEKGYREIAGLIEKGFANDPHR